jgi:hypothetical protein
MLEMLTGEHLLLFNLYKYMEHFGDSAISAQESSSSGVFER